MKIKAKTKDCKLTVKIKATIGEVINEKELDCFFRAYLRGFLKPKLIKKNVIEYTGPIGISLNERKARPITKKDFLFILEQTVVAVRNLQSLKLDINRLLLNLEHVFINEYTKEVQFIYFPIHQSVQTITLYEFIETLAYSFRVAPETDNEYISRFIFFFKSLKPFDINMIEKFVMKEDKSVVDVIHKQNGGQSGFMTDKKQQYYEHYNEKKSKQLDDEATNRLLDESTGLLVEQEDEATGLLVEQDDEATGLLVDADATALLIEEDEEGTALLVDDCIYIRYPTLCRIATNEMIQVNKLVFRIGKDRGCADYYVENSVVSRNHIDIIIRGNQYYVKDLNSKNHTYINNRMIPVNEEIEINDGDLIRLGNEEFTFNI